MYLRFLFAVAAFMLLFPLAAKQPKYLFLLIGDGMGPNVVKLYRQQMGKTSFDRMGEPIETGTNNVMGRTTDSAASGTALACGIKTYNGAIGVNKDGVPVMSLAKILKQRGMKVGIISSVAINDATPGAHYGNRKYRSYVSGILADMFVSNFDFFGVSDFKRPSELVDKDLFFMFKRNGYTVLKNQKLDQLKKENKNVYIASTRAGAKFPATLETVTMKAVELLDNPNGFFMMVEGGAIDGGNHRNDVVTMMNEMVEFDKMVGAVLDFAAKHPEDTLVVVTADHDTGGIQITGDAPKDFWKKSPMSYSKLEREITKMRKNKVAKDEIIKFVCKNTGIEVPTGKDAEKVSAAADRFLAGKQTEKGSMYGKYNPLIIEVFRVRDRQNNYHYTTFGHTSAKVLTFSVGNGKKFFTAPLENSDVPRRISMAATGVDLLEQYKNVHPFPQAQNDFHFSVQSVSSDSVTCRYNLGNEKKSVKVTLKGSGADKAVELKAPYGRITFEKLAPNTEYKVSADKITVSFRTLPVMTDVAVKGAIIADPHTSTTPDNPRQRMHSRSEKFLTDAKAALDKAKIDILLMPGDISDRSRVEEYKVFNKIFNKTSYKLIATPGNHDVLDKKNSKLYTKIFANAASYNVVNGIQFISLNTWNGKLNNPGNAEVIEKLDIKLPAVIQCHHQLVKSSNIIRDKNSAISDGKTPEVKKMLDKIAQANAIVFVGHKNAAEKVVISKTVMQINCPQLTQYPAGYLKFTANKEGIAYSFVPSAENITFEEYSRRLAPYAKREQLAVECWNNFYKWQK